jgi:hypothetical protein
LKNHNIKIDLREIGQEKGRWMELDQDGDSALSTSQGIECEMRNDRMTMNDELRSMKGDCYGLF